VQGRWCKRASVIGVLTLVVMVCFTTVAFAATFSGESPVAIPASQTLSNVVVRVTVSDPATISSATMVLDGAPTTARLYYGGHWEWDDWDEWWIEDRTVGTVTYTLPAPITIGTHDVSVTVTNGQGVTSTKTWSFVVSPTEATFNSPSPANGGTTTTWKPALGLGVYDPASLLDGPVVTIDGVNYTVPMLFGDIRISYEDWEYSQYNDEPQYQAYADFRIGYVTFTPAKLSDGPHTASVRVANPTGRFASYTWSFDVAAPPVISALTPTHLSSVANQQPVISARVEDNAVLAQSSVRMLVDGVVVPATYDPVTYLLSYTPPVPLANDRVHTVRVEATDAGGLTTAAESAFTVQIYADMQISTDCQSCHDATQHPIANCGACHGPIPVGHGLPGQPASWCLNCHGSHGPEVIIPGVTWGGGDDPQEGYTGYWGNYCTYCHSPNYPTVPRHAADNAVLHNADGDMTACSPCHVTSVSREHNRYLADSGEPYDCDTCHGASVSTAVQAAVAAGDTRCSACHASADHAALHELTAPTGCGDCHEGTNLLGIHEDAGCDGCHDSTDADVMAAISSGSLACSSCHTTQGVDYHLNMAVHLAPDSYETCGSCHHAWGSNPLRGPDVVRHAGGCTTCHNDTMDLTGLTTKCTNCHFENGVDYHLGFAVAHTPLDTASVGCARCHDTTDVSLLHTTDGCDTCHSGGCSDCHSMHGAPKTTNCARCHTTEGTNYHSAFATAHTYSAMPGGCQTTGCHAASLVGAHSAYVGAGSRYPQYVDTCALCHINADPDRIPAGATADCTTCHASADHESLHAVDLAAECADCHSGTSLTTLHTTTTCAGCHESTRTDVIAAIGGGVLECSACHGEPHGDLTAAHAASVVSGPVDVFDYHEGYSPITWDVDCTLCHASMNLLDEHADACPACHSGSKPVDSFGVWNKGCQQGACHTTIDHPSADGAHNSFDCEAACHEYDWSVYYASCDWCHNPSGAAPTTTSNVKTAYVGSATISMSAPGVAWTYYRLDGGARASGTSLLVAGPTAGTAAHTLEYWSVDDAGHEELPHKTANFTVAADTVPPTTTSNAKVSYIGPATITLSVTDNNSTPVTQTYWKLNGGMQMAGKSISVPQPASGQQSYALEFWSVDASGIEELPHKQALFTVTADNTAPTGSINISAGATYTTSQYVNTSLSASDVGGSGVSQMRLSNNNVSWTTWMPYAGGSTMTLSAGNGTKTLWVQYKDVAGNVGTFTDTIIFDNTRPTGSISINGGAAGTSTLNVTLSMTAVDALSGVSSMRFSNNNSTWSTWETYASTKAWTLLSGSGTRTAYVQLRDNAGNVNTYSDAIIVTASDTIAPTGDIVINAGANFTNSMTVTLATPATDTGGSGLSQMRFGNDNVNWSAWEPYAASKSWTVPAGDGPKMIYVQYRDVVGNGVTYSDGITLDTVVPTGSVWIDSGASVANTTAVTLALTAADTGGSGVSQMQLSNDNASWSTWEAYATSKAWTLSAGNGTKTVYARYRDVAGNVSTVCSDIIILDGSAVPVTAGSLGITGWTWVDANDGASGPWATYKIYVNDVLRGTKIAGPDSTWACPQIDLPSGGHIDITVDCGFSNYSWIFDEHRPATYTLTLPAGTTRLEATTWIGFPDMGIANEWWDDYEDYYTGVYIPAGTISNITYTSSVFADTTAPTGSITVNGGAASTNVPGVSLGLSAADTGGSGISKMQFSNDNTNWSAWETYAASKSWTLAAGNGVKTVYVRYKDVAGNVSATYSDAITLDATTNATLAFVWHPAAWAEAHLRVEDAAGAPIIDTWVSGYGSNLDLNVTVPSGQVYYMECEYYYDDYNGDEGGAYGKWTTDTTINADGVVSPGETVIWYY